MPVQIKGVGSISGLDQGIVVSGVTTAVNVSVAQSVTAAAFYGSGANLSGLASREFYGFKAVGEDLQLTTTNNGADNISLSDFESFEDTMTAPSGLSFQINNLGELEMTV